MTAAPMNRMGFIGGSDARRILEGRWLELYEEKLGIRAQEDLSHVFRVQLGKFTEPFHAQWLVDEVGLPIVNPQGVYIHPGFDWLRGTVDGWLADADTFIELKHTKGYADRHEMVDQYLPQIAHYCLATGRSHGYLSFIAGNADPVICKVEPTKTYLEELESLEESFWWHIANKVAPDAVMDAEQFAEAAAQAANVKIDGFRSVNMQGNNHWADLALALFETKASAEIFNKAKDEIKKLVAPDVGKAEGHGITIKRDKLGSLRFTFAKEAA